MNIDGDLDTCGVTGGTIPHFSGCGEKVHVDDRRMLGSTSFCIKCQEIYQEAYNEEDKLLTIRKNDIEESEESEEEFEAEAWIYDGVTYLVDEGDNLVYDFDTHAEIGERVNDHLIKH